MTWRVADQDFNAEGVGPGRIVVHLADGHHLSVITADRNDVIREAKRWSPSALVGSGWDVTDVQADEGNFEVGLLDEVTDFAGRRMDPEPDGWASHAVNVDGWIYQNITADMIETVVAERGLAE